MVNTASTILVTGKPLPKDVHEKTIEACDLDSPKKKVVEFVEIKTRLIAPNLSAVFGSKVATKLMISAGGLSALAKMPPICNVHQHAGQKRKKSFVGSLAEILNETEIVQNTPPKYQNHACEFLAEKLTLAARVDSTRGDSSGAKGRALRDEVLAEIDMLQKPKQVSGPGTMLFERMVKEQSTSQSRELGDETQSKYFSKFGTFSKINKSLAGDKVFKF